MLLVKSSMFKNLSPKERITKFYYVNVILLISKKGKEDNRFQSFTLMQKMTIDK
jgi:hypothetical protein